MINRSALAIIANSQTPYRLHLHQRIAREMTDIQLFSIFTHEMSNAPWAFTAPAEIGPVLMGKGEASDKQSNWRSAWAEYLRGGRVIRFLLEKDVRAVVVMGYNDAGRMRIMRWCHRHGVKCFLFGDSNIRGERPSTGILGNIKAIVKRAYLKTVIHWCDGVLVCGTLGKAYFQNYGASPERIYFFPYEPDYELIQTAGQTRATEVAHRFGLASGRRRLVYSGRLTQIKRVDLLIDAFARIAAARPNWDLLVIGDGPLRAELTRRVDPTLQVRIKWTGFVDDQSMVGALYCCCDVLVLPSDHEPWALVVNEAVAANLAVVSTDVVGASAELVRDGVNGRIIPCNDLNQLTDALLDVTSENRIDQYRQASAPLLADWRKRGDPIEGLRAAIRQAMSRPA